MDPTITKASTGNERLVAACAESQSTSRGPNRTRFLTVQEVIRVKMKKHMWQQTRNSNATQRNGRSGCWMKISLRKHLRKRGSAFRQ